VLGAVLANASGAAARPVPPPRAAIRSGRGSAQETSFGLSGPVDLSSGGGSASNTTAACRPYLDVEHTALEEADYLTPVGAAPAVEQEGDYLVPIRPSAPAVAEEGDYLVPVSSSGTVVAAAAGGGHAASFAAIAARDPVGVVGAVSVADAAAAGRSVAARQQTVVNIDMMGTDAMFTI
jgi:hypothetical protein